MTGKISQWQGRECSWLLAFSWFRKEFAHIRISYAQINCIFVVFFNIEKNGGNEFSTMLMGLSYKHGGIFSDNFLCVFSFFKLIYIDKFDFAITERKC